MVETGRPDGFLNQYRAGVKGGVIAVRTLPENQRARRDEMKREYHVDSMLSH